MTRFIRALSAACLATAVMAVGGCATTGEPPKDERARATLAIEQAEAAGASQFAPLALRNARKNLEAGEGQAAAEDYAAARYSFIKAEADAQFAERKAEAAKTERLSEEAETSNQALESEIERQEGRQ